MENLPAQSEQPVSTGTGQLVLDPVNMKSIMDFAHFMASGASTLPKHLRGNPADCMAIVIQSMQWKMNPYAVAQKTFVVPSGQLGYEAQLVNAVVTASGVIEDDFDYEYYGDWSKVIGNFKTLNNGKGDFQAPAWSKDDEKGCGLKISAVMTKSGKTKVLDLLLSQATVRNSTLWASDPKQQLAYLTVKRWARLHCPGVMLGVYTRDELEESRPAERNITPTGEPQGALSRPVEKEAAQQDKVVAETPKLSIDDLLEVLAKATTIDQLQSIAEDAATLPEGPDREKLRSYYVKRLAAITEKPTEKEVVETPE
jgi:RecT family